MKYSLCLTNYNRYEMLIESFAQVIDDPRIDDIQISDDCSDVEIYNKLVAYFSVHKYGYKVSMSRNSQNFGMSRNKKLAVSMAANEWAILADSDNIFGKDYLDALDKGVHVDEETNTRVIFCPSFAKPNFSFKAFEDKIYDSSCIGELVNYPMGATLLNCCNYLVNRDFYLYCYDYNETIKASDTIYHAYNHLRCGGYFCVVKGLSYIHRVHDGSGFLEDVRYNLDKAEEIKQLILNLK